MHPHDMQTFSGESYIKTSGANFGLGSDSADSFTSGMPNCTHAYMHTHIIKDTTSCMPSHARTLMLSAFQALEGSALSFALVYLLLVSKATCKVFL